MTIQTRTDASASNSNPFTNKEHALVKYGIDPSNLIHEQGRYWMTAKEIGVALGYNDPANSINRLYSRHKEELESFKGRANLTDHLGIPHETSIFNTDGMWLIALFANTPKAKKFRKFVVNMLKALERQEFIHVSEIEQWSRDIKRMKQDLTDLKISSYVFNTLRMNCKQYNKLIRYRNMGLSEREIAKLLDIKRYVVRKIERISREYDGYDYPGKFRPILIKSDLDELLANKKPVLRSLKGMRKGGTS